MMTRKDYIAIAEVIRGVLQDLTDDECMESEDGLMVATYIAAIGHGLANHMEQDNPNFNRSKFIEASSRVEVQAVPSDIANLIHTLHGGDTNGN
jgi:hypothetical protein